VIVSWIEYAHFNCHVQADIETIVETCFMGETMGRDLLYSVAFKSHEIMAYIPDTAINFRYAKTYKDGFYLICEVPDANPPDVRFHSFY
jgi:hypothetical protein